MSFVAAGVGIAGLGFGVYQSIHGASQAKKQQRALESKANGAPTYGPNKSINDYYQTALGRYNVDPTNSLQYQQAQRGINNNLASGISAIQDRRSAGALPRLMSAADNQLTNAGVRAEQSQNQRFNELGRATQMKSGDDRYAFNVNQEQPYQRQYDLIAQKASGANRELSAGLQNINNGLQSFAAMKSAGAYGNLWGNKATATGTKTRIPGDPQTPNSYTPMNGYNLV